MSRTRKVEERWRRDRPSCGQKGSRGPGRWRRVASPLAGQPETFGADWRRSPKETGQRGQVRSASQAHTAPNRRCPCKADWLRGRIVRHAHCRRLILFNNRISAMPVTLNISGSSRPSQQMETALCSTRSTLPTRPFIITRSSPTSSLACLAFIFNCPPVFALKYTFSA